MAENLEWWQRAQAVRKELKRCGKPMRYVDIGEAIGVKPARVGHWFVGRRPAPVPMVEAIAKYMGVHVGDWFAPLDGMFITDAKVIAAIKLMSQLQEAQKSLPVPKAYPTPKLARKHHKRAA